MGARREADQERSNGWHRQSPAKSGRRFHSSDRGKCRRVRAALADWNTSTRVARRVALHGLVARRRRAIGRQHVRDDIGSIKTEESGFGVLVTLPILPVLAETLAAGPCGDLTFIAGERGNRSPGIQRLLPRPKAGIGGFSRSPTAPFHAELRPSSHGAKTIVWRTVASLRTDLVPLTSEPSQN